MDKSMTPPCGKKKGAAVRRGTSPQDQGKQQFTKHHTEKPEAAQTKAGWAAHPIDAFTHEEIIERFGGGAIDELGLLVPGPGHSDSDASLRLFLNPALPDGFYALSFAGDDPATCRAHVLQTLGIKTGGARVKLSPEQKAEREAVLKEIKEKLAAQRKEKTEKAAVQWDKAQPVTAYDLDFELVNGKGPKGFVNKYLNGRAVQILDNTAFRWEGAWCANSGKGHPAAMLAKIVSWEDGKTTVGIHKTFIGLDAKNTTIEIGGDDNCEHVKRITVGGNKGIIWLYRGDPGADVGCFGEGVETTLSFAHIPEAKGAALISYVTSGNLKDMPVPKKYRVIFIAVDIEKSGVGKRSAEAYAARCVKAGKVVFLVYPTATPDAKGKIDLNDVVRAPGFGPSVGYRIVKMSPEAGEDTQMRNDETVDAYEARFIGDELSPPEYSETELASLLDATYGVKIRYVDAWGKWFIFNGKVWKEDQTQRVYSYARKVCIRAAASLGESSSARTLARKIASSSTINAVVKIAQALPRIAATVDQWDADLWLLNTPKGVVDLRTGKMRKHNPEDYMTRITSVSPGGSCPRFLKFLGEITADDEELIAYLQRKNGYSLTGVTTEHAVFFTYGDGRNGKSVYLNTIGWVMGDYCAVAPITTFIVTNFEQHPTDLADLRGARMVRCSEVAKGQRWAEEKIKQMSGGDPIKARFMRQDFFTYDPQFKLEFIGNVQPSLRTVDEAAKARFQMIPFTVFIKPEDRDHDLETKLRAEGPGILQWMIEGCLEWQRKGLAPPPAVVAASEAYIHQQDVTEQWLEECCEKGSAKDPTTKTKLWQSWEGWAKGAGEFVGTKKDLMTRLKAKGFEEGKISAGACFRGLTVVYEKEEEPLTNAF